MTRLAELDTLISSTQAAIDGAAPQDRPWLVDQLQTMLKERERLADLDGAALLPFRLTRGRQCLR